jgi:hypothetical protein
MALSEIGRLVDHLHIFELKLRGFYRELEGRASIKVGAPERTRISDCFGELADAFWNMPNRLKASVETIYRLAESRHAEFLTENSTLSSLGGRLVWFVSKRDRVTYEIFPGRPSCSTWVRI